MPFANKCIIIPDSKGFYSPGHASLLNFRKLRCSLHYFLSSQNDHPAVLFVCVEVLRPCQQLRSCRAGQLLIYTVLVQAYVY